MIKVLSEKDTDAFIKLRLHALKESPQAFGASYEEGVDRGQTFMNFKNRREDYFVLGYFEIEQLVGIVGFVRESKLKKKHKAVIWGMYVNSDFRGKGIARKLLIEVIERAGKIGGLSKIMITVTSPQENVLGFYERLGFLQYSLENDAMRVGEQRIDEIFLSLEL